VPHRVVVALATVLARHQSCVVGPRAVLGEELVQDRQVDVGFGVISECYRAV